MVDVRTLGTAGISLDGERRIGLLTDPDAFALFVLIALEGHVDRATLNRLVVSAPGRAGDSIDEPPDFALDDLLAVIEASLGPGAIKEEDGRIRLNPALDIRLDAARFNEAIQRGDLEAAAREYGGSFLAGLPAPGLDGLRRWTEATRRRFAAALEAPPSAHGLGSRPVDVGRSSRGAEPGQMAPPLADPPRSRLQRLMDRVRGRMTYQVAAIYLMVSWAALQVVDMLVDREVLGDFAFRAALLLAIMGLPIVVILAWVRDEKGVSVGDYPDTRGPWPRWIQKTRTGPVLVALAAVFAILLTTFFVLRQVLPAPAVEPASPDPGSIAVLYFDDYTADQELGPTAAGFTSDLIDQLHAVPTLDVRSLSAVKPYRTGDVPLDSLFRRLDVGAIVEGGLARTADSLMARVRLLAASDSGTRVLASASLAGAVGGELALGADLAAEVARLLREKLGVEIRLQSLRRQTDSDEAWLLVQRALEVRDEARQRMLTDKTAAARLLSASDSLLAEAEEADPDWVKPVIERGWTAEQRALVETEFAGNYDVAWAHQALDHADRAIAMAPADPAAAELRGRLRQGLAEVASDSETEELMRGAERDLLAALETDPNRPIAALALSRLYRRQTRFEEAAHYARLALDADYFFDEAQEVVWQLYLVSNDLRQAGEAESHCAQGRRRWEAGARWYLCGIMLLKSYAADTADVRRAWEWHDALVRLSAESQRDNTRRYSLMLMAGVAAKANLSDSARALIVRARAPEPLPILAYDEAHAWMLLGEPDSALDRLETYVAFRPAARESLPADWWFEELFGSARFQRITRERGDS